MAVILRNAHSFFMFIFTSFRLLNVSTRILYVQAKDEHYQDLRATF